MSSGTLYPYYLRLRRELGYDPKKDIGITAWAAESPNYRKRALAVLERQRARVKRAEGAAGAPAPSEDLPDTSEDAW